MADKFDQYREALVMETETKWPTEYDHLDEGEKVRLAAILHADPEQVNELAYVRTHTGFCREITVTEDDITRMGG